MHKNTNAKRVSSKHPFKCPLIAGAALSAFFYYQNNALTTSRYTIKSDVLPASFKGFRIAHISDLHNKSFGCKNEKLLQKLKIYKPDAIFITGDLIDSRRSVWHIATDFIENAAQTAPVYYVCGNHELRDKQYALLRRNIIAAGATVLEDAMLPITKGTDSIHICGMRDPSVYAQINNRNNKDTKALLSDQLKNVLQGDTAGYKILLIHQPQFLKCYSDFGFDLVFSGHAHGGQWRIPAVNAGLIAPGQGILPRLTGGVYNCGKTKLVLSRGLGNSLFPLRLFNRPELVIADLL